MSESLRILETFGPTPEKIAEAGNSLVEDLLGVDVGLNPEQSLAVLHLYSLAFKEGVAARDEMDRSKIIKDIINTLEGSK